MTPAFLHRLRRAGALAVALIGVTLAGAAMPSAAVANGWSSYGSFGTHLSGGGFIQLTPHPPAYVPNDFNACLSQSQIRYQLSDHGFQQVSFEDSNDSHYFVFAVADGWLFSLVVDCCTGELTSVHKVRRIHDGCDCGPHDDDWFVHPGNANGHFKLRFRLN